MSFHVGQRVVCVDASEYAQFLTQGEIYTVISVGSKHGIPGSWISIDCTPDVIGNQSYRSRRFRPLITRSTETGMAILRKVADDAAKRRKYALQCGLSASE